MELQLGSSLYSCDASRTQLSRHRDVIRLDRKKLTRPEDRLMLSIDFRASRNLIKPKHLFSMILGKNNYFSTKQRMSSVAGMLYELIPSFLSQLAQNDESFSLE